MNDVTDADALELLAADHRRLETLFGEFDDWPDASKRALIEETCRVLSAHTQIEEALFYPAIQEAGGQRVEHAKVEHDCVKQLVSKLQSGLLDDAARDATFTVMAQMTQRHIQQEERELFPLARNSSIDLQALARKMREQQASLREHPVLIQGQHAQARESAEHVG